MNSSDDDYDAEREFDDVDEDSVEAKVWQLLLLINPGDEETALLQFNDYREAMADVDADEVEPIEVIGRAIDWRSGFIVDAHDLRSLVQAINELSSRWNLSVDWNGDPDDDEFFDDMDAANLLQGAFIDYQWHFELVRLSGNRAAIAAYGKAVPPAGAQDHMRAMSRRQQGQGSADPAAGAGNGDDLAGDQPSRRHGIPGVFHTLNGIWPAPPRRLRNDAVHDTPSLMTDREAE